MAGMDLVNYDIYMSTVGNKDVYPLLMKIVGATYNFLKYHLHYTIGDEKEYIKLRDRLAWTADNALRHEYRACEYTLSITADSAGLDSEIAEIFKTLNAEIEKVGISLLVTIVEDTPISNMQYLHMRRLFEGRLPIKIQKVRHGKRL